MVPLVEELAQDKIQQRAVGFPEGFKSVKLSIGNYSCERVGDICYYVFEDCCRVCFVSNVFPKAMETQVVRVQLDRTLQFKSIPPLLPAYNTYMGGVDRLSQVRKTYGFEQYCYVLFSVFFYNTIASCLICLPKSC